MSIPVCRQRNSLYCKNNKIYDNAKSPQHIFIGYTKRTKHIRIMCVFAPTNYVYIKKSHYYKKEISRIKLQLISLRKERDSNPRYGQSRTADFESAPIDHSGIFPFAVAKIGTFLYTAKWRNKFKHKCEYENHIHTMNSKILTRHKTCKKDFILLCSTLPWKNLAKAIFAWHYYLQIWIFPFLDINSN